MDQIHLIQDEDTYILFHIPSSQFFEISRDVYERLKSFKEHGDTDVTQDVKICQIINHLNMQSELATTAVEHSSMMNKLTFLSTQDCNLRCRYCFASHGLYSTGKRSRMSFEVYRNSLGYFLDKYPQGIKFIEFFGGEPLLGFEEIKAFIPYCIEQTKQRGIRQPRFGLITNGTLLTEEMLKFFNEYCTWITVSLDGDKDINDMVRISATGSSVFDMISRSMALVKNRHNLILHSVITINKEHLLAYRPGEAVKWVEEIRKLGFNGVVVSPVDTRDESLQITEADEATYRKVYGELVDYLFKKLYDESQFISSDIIRAIQSLNRRTKSPLPCYAGTNSFTVGVEGEILPCYMMHGNDDFLMGSVYRPNEAAFGEVQNVLTGHSNRKPPQCSTCWVRNVCAIWCRGFSYNFSGNMYSVSPGRCWTSQVVFERVLIQLVRVQKDQAEYQRFKEGIRFFQNKYSQRLDCL